MGPRFTASNAQVGLRHVSAAMHTSGEECALRYSEHATLISNEHLRNERLSEPLCSEKGSRSGASYIKERVLGYLVCQECSV